MTPIQWSSLNRLLPLMGYMEVMRTDALGPLYPSAPPSAYPHHGKCQHSPNLHGFLTFSKVTISVGHSGCFLTCMLPGAVDRPAPTFIMAIRYKGMFAAFQGHCSLPSSIPPSTGSRCLLHYRLLRPDCSGITLPKSSSRLHQKIP